MIFSKYQVKSFTLNGHTLLLGPLLFKLYRNDLPKILDLFSKAVPFANETSILISNKDTLKEIGNIVLNHCLGDFLSMVYQLIS